MPTILGISAFYHDSAAALAVDGRIVAAAQEERFTRVKHTPDFPMDAIRYCLEEDGKDINGTPVLINTSVNVRGEPIVFNPDDAYRCFMATDMDVLVVNGFLSVKEQQPDHADSKRWNREFAPY